MEHPTETVQLPSRGIPYDGLVPGGEVTIRPITTDEEEILQGRKDRRKKLDEVIQMCVVSPDIAIEDLLVADRFFLLIQIRAFSYGSSYQFDLRCPNCNIKFNRKMNLPDDLAVFILDDTDTEPYEVELPISGTKLGLRRLRMRDEDDIARFGRTQTQTGDRDPTYRYRLAKHIVTIDGQSVDANAALNFVKGGMIGGDSAAMRTAMDDADCGFDFTVEHECPDCHHDWKAVFPQTEDFFRPRTVSVRRPAESVAAAGADTPGQAGDLDGDPRGSRLRDSGQDVSAAQEEGNRDSEGTG